MKKWIVFLALMIFSVNVWALPENIGAVVETSDIQVKATPGVVYSVVVSYAGVTAGDKIEIKNSKDTSGSAQYTCIASGTNGVCSPIAYTTGNYFSTAIYYDETKTGGTFTTEIQYF